jgi:hypothetical protein
MDTTTFCYWLKGFFEISDTNKLNEKQVQIIRDHLDLVFNKVTPDRFKDEVKRSKVEESPYVDLGEVFKNLTKEPKVYCTTPTIDWSSLDKKLC